MESPVSIATLRALRRILRESERSGRQLASATGLTPSQMLVLQEVARRGGTNPTVVAQTLHFGQATVTNIADRLVALGLLVRRKGEHDRRTVLLSLTDAGQQALEVAPDGLQDRFVGRFEALEAWEQAMILAALERLGDLMGSEERDAVPLIDIGPIET